MKYGFTLIEVVMALLIMEIATFGVLGSLVLASETMHRAEALERATARAEGVLDSLRYVVAPGTGSRGFSGGEVRWSIDDEGRITLAAVDARGRRLLGLVSRVRLR